MKAGRLRRPAGRRRQPALLPPRRLHRSRRGRRRLPLRPREAQGGHAPRQGGRLRPLRRRQARARPREGGLAPRRTWRDKLDLAKFKLDVGRIQVKVDPPAEWAQIFDEAWRINRDYFYDPGYPRRRLAGHAGEVRRLPARPGHPQRPQPRRSSGCSASWRSATPTSRPATARSRPRRSPAACSAPTTRSANGRYRFKKVFGGLNWNPDLRSPLTEPGVDVKAGEYLLAVDGKDLRHPENLYARFERTAGPHRRDHGRARRPTARARAPSRSCPSRTSGRCATATGSRATSRRVDRGHAGDGSPTSTCPNTADAGHTYFKRYFFPQADRQADHRRRAAQRRRLGGRLLHRHPAPAGGQLLGHALRRRPQDADRRHPRARRSC